MTEHILEAKAPALEQVVQQFETWRNTRKGRQPIPDLLWQAAVNLFPIYSTNKIARALRLDYTKLKKRIEDANSNSNIIQNVSPDFIELDLGTSPAAAFECTLEIKSSSGSQLKMHWKDDRGFDALEVCKAFWSESV